MAKKSKSGKPSSVPRRATPLIPGTALARAAHQMAKAARDPIVECLITTHWQEQLMASILVVRQGPGGAGSVGGFIVDLGCLGIKDALARPGLAPAELRRSLERFREGQPLVPCTPGLALRVVEDARAYAGALGFNPAKAYWAARPVLDGVEPDLETPVTCGRDGMPFYVAGPRDDAQAVVEHLAERLGTGNFHYLVNTGGRD